MESGLSHRSNINVTCMPFESRALCAICGARAIGKKDPFVGRGILSEICFCLGRNFDAYTCLSCKGNKYNISKVKR